LSAEGSRSPFDLADQELGSPKEENRRNEEKISAARPSENDTGKTRRVQEEKKIKRNEPMVKFTALFPKEEALAVEKLCLDLRVEGLRVSVSKLLRASFHLGQLEEAKLKEIIQQLSDGRFRTE